MKTKLNLKASLVTATLILTLLTITSTDVQAIPHYDVCVQPGNGATDCVGTSGMCQSDPDPQYNWCVIEFVGGDPWTGRLCGGWPILAQRICV